MVAGTSLENVLVLLVLLLPANVRGASRRAPQLLVHGDRARVHQVVEDDVGAARHAAAQDGRVDGGLANRDGRAGEAEGLLDGGFEVRDVGVEDGGGGG
jgi:hypothetical protein